MATLSNNDIARAIYLVSKEKNVDQHTFSKKVVEFLVRKRLLQKSKDILSRLETIINQEEGRIIAKVSSKDNLNEKVKRELGASLVKRYKAKDVALSPHLDERLLGGFRIEVKDEVIDLTIKNKISKLQEYLTKNV